jgi:hypothetical protein
MLRLIQFMVAMVFFLVLYITTLAPAIERVSSAIRSVNGPAAVGDFALIETALFVGLPLVFLGGIILIVFVAASGLRGTSI